MPRSPLFRFLARAQRAHHISAVTGVPADVVLARAQERRSSRRRFLQAAGVVGIAPLLKACPPLGPNPIPSDETIGIVGAGMAGLHCAYRLKNLGIAATIYEAQARLGGRMFTDRTTFAAQDGQHCELGGELIDTGHATMIDLADELGLALNDYDDDDAALDKTVAFFDGANVPIADVLTAYAPIAARIDADLATIGGDGYVYYNENNGGNALDALSIRGWFDALVLDGTIAEDNIARRLFEVAYNIEYGRETDEQSVLNMLFLTSTDTANLALFGDSDERFGAVDGSDSFTSGLAAAIDGQIVTERKLTRITKESDGRLRLSFDAGEDAVHDHVVLSVPFSVLREVELVDVVLSPAKQLAIDTLGYGTNAKLMLGFEERTWRTTGGSSGETFSDLSYQATWETSRLQPGAAGIITNYTGGQPGLDVGEGTPADAAARFLTQLEQVFPGVSASHNDRVARFHWPTHAFTKGSYACYLVGQYTTLTGCEAEPEGNLHFCGEHTSLDAQGYMEGAALSGAAAADEVAVALGVEAPQALFADSPAVRIMSRARIVREQRRWKHPRAPMPARTVVASRR